MCMSSAPSRKCNPVHIRRIKRMQWNRRRLSKQAKEERRKTTKMVNENQMKMIIKNLELYLENQNIMQENERLRERAALLTKENDTLSSQLQNLSRRHLPS